MDVQTLLMNRHFYSSNETNLQYDIYGFHMDWNKASLPADVADCEDTIAVDPLNTGYIKTRELI